MEQSQAQPADTGASASPACGAERLHTIGDMARLYNVTLRALRFYEDRGLISPIRQGHSRYYDSAARLRLETILRGKKLGFTLGQIAELAPREAATQGTARLDLGEAQVLNQIRQLERKRCDIDEAISELRQAHLAMTGERPSDSAAAA